MAVSVVDANSDRSCIPVMLICGDFLDERCQHMNAFLSLVIIAHLVARFIMRFLRVM